MSTAILYLPSTPLNVLVSCAHAIAYNKSSKKVLWLIDQKNCADNLYVRALQEWEDSPFSQVTVLCGNKKGLAKLKQRKQNFKWLNNRLANLQPKTVFTGSDRRIEFQYVMHCLKDLNPLGGYLDDGLYSYTGRRQVWYKDLFSSWLKKLSYGYWWEEPVTVGASSKIQQLHLFQPEAALSILKKNKQVIALNNKLFLNNKIFNLSSSVLKLFAEDINSYALIDVLIFIPHPNNVAKMNGYLLRLQTIISKLKNNANTIAIKYHPRVSENDPLELQKLGVSKIIPAGIASEFVLPVLPANCAVFGDVGTALLTCHWLRPDLNLTAILSKEDYFQQSFGPIMRQMGIKVISLVEEIEV
jgi:hypothetical protein